MPLDRRILRDVRLSRAAQFTATLTFVLAVLFRKQLWTGFGFLFGDRNDAVIEAALLEHWFNVLRGISRWREVEFFYPYRDGLGYNDGYILYGVIYSPFRALGADPLLASELVNIVVKAAGFAAFFAACRRMFRLSQAWSLFGAALFALSYNGIVQAGHAQLFAVSFVPLQALFLWEFFRALCEQDRLRIILWGFLAGIFFGAWLLTAYYTAWFFAFFMLFFLPAAVLFSDDRRQQLSAIRNCTIPLLAVAAVSLLALVPALLVYLPKAQETGMRGWAEATEFAIPPLDILNFGRGEYLFGGLFAMTVALLCPACSTANSELTTGYPPIILAMFVSSCVWLWRGRATPRPLLVSMAVAAILSWMFCLRIRDVTPWRLIYDWLPGAKALRVVSRYQLVLTAPVVALATCFLADLSRSVPRVSALVLSALLVAEELGTCPVGLDRTQELRRVTDPAPPADCRVFYVTASPDQETAAGRFRALLPHNVDAMLIAEMKDLPTVNGFASFTPSDWNFGAPDAADYTQRVSRYAARHGLSHMCRLNLETHRWQLIGE